jgi:hypothetical protein
VAERREQSQLRRIAPRERSVSPRQVVPPMGCH